MLGMLLSQQVCGYMEIARQPCVRGPLDLTRLEKRGVSKELLKYCNSGTITTLYVLEL